MNATDILPDNNGRALVLVTVLVLSMVALATAFAGGAAASQHDIDVSFNDTEGDVGENVTVSFDIDPANAPNAQVSGYDVQINYDPSVVSFVEMNGEDLAQPTVNDDGAGTITANAGQASGEDTPLTAATITFQIDQSAQGGDSASIDINASYNNEFLDDPDPSPDQLTFESQAGSVQVVTTDSDYQLSNLVPQDATVFQGSNPITVSADVTNDGTEAGDQTVTLEVADQSGNVVFSDSQSNVQVGPGETQTVSFQGVPAGALDTGDYTHSIDTNDDSISGSLTVQTIQQAINDASEGDTIAVPDGTYPEDPTINNDGLTLEGPGLDDTANDANITGEVTINGNDNKITGVVIDNDVTVNGDNNNIDAEISGNYTDNGNGNVRGFTVGPGLDIEITDVLTIGDDYPQFFNNLGGDVYTSETGISPPTAVDERYAPFLEGQHVGITGLPVVQTDDTYDWVVDQGLLGDSTVEQKVEVSFDANDGSATLDYRQTDLHRLEVDNPDPDDLVEEVSGIDRDDLGVSNVDLNPNSPGPEGVALEYDPADATDSTIRVRFGIEWSARNSIEGLDVDATNNIDFGTAHRIQQGNERVSDTFVTFETGTTGISHNDAVAPSNFNDEFPSSSLEGPSTFEVRQDQLVTFEVEDNEDSLSVYEYETDSDGNVVLEDSNQVDDDQISFDQTQPGQVANLNIGNLSTGDYLVQFDNSGDVVGLDVLNLNLGADTPDDTGETTEFVELPVTADQSAEGDDVEAYFYEAGESGIGNVVHVERDQLGGDGDALLDDVSPTADLNADVGDEFYAVVKHLNSGVTVQTGNFSIGVAGPPPTPIDFADDVTIESPSLEAPEEPGRFDRGDVIPIELDLEGGNAATITFGNAENENVEVHATVYNEGYTQQNVRENDDSEVTVYLSTYHIGHGYVNQNTTTDPSGYTSADLNLTLNSPPYATGAAPNRSHGFFAEPSSDSALVPEDRLDREHNVFAHGSIDIYGGSQSGAVLSSQVSYDFHAASDSSELPYTLLGEDREEDRDDINFLDVGQRSTEDFRYWRAPSDLNLDRDSDGNITIENIEDKVGDTITPLETENGEFVGQLAEDDFIIVQAQATGTEGVLLEAVRRNGLDLQEYVDTIQGESVDDEVTLEFEDANSTVFDRNVTVEEPEPGYANNTLLDYRFSIEETAASENRRFDLTGPNVADEVNTITPELNRLDVIAGLNFDDSSSSYYIPYQVTEDLPVPTGNVDVGELEFNVSSVFDVRGGAQSNSSTFRNESTTISIEDNGLLSNATLGANNVTNLGYVQAAVAFDDVHVVEDEDNSTVWVPAENYTLTGTTTLAPGTEVNLRLLSDLDEATPFLKTSPPVTVEAQSGSPNSTFEATFDFSETRDGVTIQGGTPFEIDVLDTTGTELEGGDDVRGLVLEGPEVPTFEFNEQRSDGNAVSVAAYESNRVSQITILNEDGLEIGTSEVLPANELQEQFNVVLDQPLSSNQEVTAVAEFVKPDPAQFDDTTLAEESAEILIEDLSEPFFSVGGLSPSAATVEVGTEVTVEATVTNLGDQEGTQSVTLSAGDFSDSQEVTLAGDASETVSFTFNSDGLGPGEYTHTVSTEDGEAAGSLTVEAQPDPGVFEIVSNSLSPMSATVTQGDEVVVSVSVQNVGGQETTEDVTLEVSGLGEVGSESLTLAPGDANSVSFTVPTSDVDAGDYTHTVSTAEDSAEGSLTIEEPEPMDDSDNNTNETDDGGDGSGPGFGIAAAALALLGAALLAMRRRTE